MDWHLKKFAHLVLGWWRRGLGPCFLQACSHLFPSCRPLVLLSIFSGLGLCSLETHCSSPPRPSLAMCCLQGPPFLCFFPVNSLAGQHHTWHIAASVAVPILLRTVALSAMPSDACVGAFLTISPSLPAWHPGPGLTTHTHPILSTDETDCRHNCQTLRSERRIVALHGSHSNSMCDVSCVSHGPLALARTPAVSSTSLAILKASITELQVPCGGYQPGRPCTPPLIAALPGDNVCVSFMFTCSAAGRTAAPGTGFV